MNIINIMLLLVLILSCSVNCRADSVVISFEGGKTQTVILDGSIKSIKSVQYLPSSDQTQAVPVPATPPPNTATSASKHEENPAQQQQTPAKPMVKFKWAEPIIGQ